MYDFRLSCICILLSMLLYINSSRIKMKKNRAYLLCILLLVGASSSLSAKIKMTTKQSKLTVHPSCKFIVATPITDMNGTLEVNGAVSGSSISFNKGVLQTQGTPATLTGEMVGGSPHQITLTTSNSLQVESGVFLSKIAVVRKGNRLQGSPLFSTAGTINMSHHLSDLTVAVQGPLNANIAMNRGTILLDDNLAFANDRVMTGSGLIKANAKQISFGGSDWSATHTVWWSDVSDMKLNSKIALSGMWTISGTGANKQANIAGNGKTIDLSYGGTIWVKAGTRLSMTNIFIRGLGIGRIIFEDKNSRIHFSNAHVELVSNYTLTNGGIYIEGNTTFITRNNILTFSQRATLTVDGTTLWYDSLSYPDASNIQPLSTAANNPGGKNVALINNGTIRPILENVRSTSNAIVSMGSQLRTHSNSVLKSNNDTRAHSNTILRLHSNHSNAMLRLTTNHSNALVKSNKDVRGHSNSILRLHANHSNSILRLHANHSNAILKSKDDVRGHSNTILRLNNNHSNSILRLHANHSNAILKSKDDVRGHSNSILRLHANHSNSILRLHANHSNAILKSKDDVGVTVIQS
jgi:hypothetical protein